MPIDANFSILNRTSSRMDALSAPPSNAPNTPTTFFGEDAYFAAAKRLPFPLGCSVVLRKASSPARGCPTFFCGDRVFPRVLVSSEPPFYSPLRIIGFVPAALCEEQELSESFRWCASPREMEPLFEPGALTRGLAVRWLINSLAAAAAAGVCGP